MAFFFNNRYQQQIPRLSRTPSNTSSNPKTLCASQHESSVILKVMFGQSRYNRLPSRGSQKQFRLEFTRVERWRMTSSPCNWCPKVYRCQPVKKCEWLRRRIAQHVEMVLKNAARLWPHGPLPVVMKEMMTDKLVFFCLGEIFLRTKSKRL